MNTFDFSPLFRSAVGFDHLYSKLDNATRTAQKQPNFPPYNIELIDDDSYRITMAVAGFDESELSIQMESTVLTVSGNQAEQKDEKHYLHHGIAARNFEHRFQLADHVNVVDAGLVNGLLNINLVREIPEAMKPHNIAINTTSAISKPTKLKDASVKAA